MNTVDQYDDALRKSLETRVARNSFSGIAKLTRWNLGTDAFRRERRGNAQRP